MSDDKVKTLTPATVAPDKHVVEVCEKLLDMAKSGKLRSLVAAGNLTDKEFYTVIETHDVVESMGLVGMMMFRVGAVSDQTRRGE